MGDVFAIVSKAVFEKEARIDGQVIGIGDVWPVARYSGTNKVFEAHLSGGGRIFMVTVRPPDEKLWLLAILESPKFDAKAKAWVAAPNAVPATDISKLRKTIKFESGKGMSQDKGALGMSLQTPRALGPGDAEQILGLTGGGGAKAGKGKGGAKALGDSDAGSASAAKIGKLTTRSRDRVAALLGAIRDEPDDAANRQVLADQYEAAGDVDRARFIRSQVARWEIPRWDPRVVAMTLDEREILRAHEAAWRAELPQLDGVRYVGYERGITAFLKFDDPALIGKHIDTLLTACPAPGIMMRWPRRNARPKLDAIPGIRALHMNGTLLSNADMTWLAKSPVLSTIQELTFDVSYLKDDALKILLGSPHLGKLRRLRLPFHSLTNKGMELLAEASLPQLVELDLEVQTQDRLGSGGRDGEGITAEGVIALCEWDQMAKVERLGLTGCQIGAEGLTAILTSPNTKRLKALEIRSVSDWDWEMEERPDVLSAFANAKDDRAFEELDIGENELTDVAVDQLKKSPVLDKLRMFAFDFSADDTQVARLLDAKWLDEVRVLSLEETSLPVVKKLLGKAPKSLHTLSLLSSFPRSALGGIANTITSAPAQKGLLSLDLTGCDVDDAGLKKLGAAKTLPALIELRLGVNFDSPYADEEEPPFSEEAAESFLASALGKKLRSVDLGIESLDRLPRPRDWDNDDDDDDDDDDYDDDE